MSHIPVLAVLVPPYKIWPCTWNKNQTYEAQQHDVDTRVSFLENLLVKGVSGILGLQMPAQACGITTLSILEQNACGSASYTLSCDGNPMLSHPVNWQIVSHAMKMNRGQFLI